LALQRKGDVSRVRGSGSEEDTGTTVGGAVVKETQVYSRGSGSEEDTGTTVGEAVVKKTQVYSRGKGSEEDTGIQ
jgi:hypothetical protein